MIVAGQHSKVANRATRIKYLKKLSLVGLEDKDFEKAEKALEDIIKLLLVEIVSLEKAQGGTTPEEKTRLSLKQKRATLIETLASLVEIKLERGSNVIWNAYCQKVLLRADSFINHPFFADPDPKELANLAEVKSLLTRSEIRSNSYCLIKKTQLTKRIP